MDNDDPYLAHIFGMLNNDGILIIFHYLPFWFEAMA